MNLTYSLIAVGAIWVASGCSGGGVTVANTTTMVGIWRAHHDPLTPPPALVDDQTRKSEEDVAAMLNRIDFDFKLNKDGTCLLEMSGLQIPGSSAPEVKHDGIPGTWTLKGNKLNVTLSSSKGKVADFTVSPDGKSFSHGHGATFMKE